MKRLFQFAFFCMPSLIGFTRMNDVVQKKPPYFLFVHNPIPVTEVDSPYRVSGFMVEIVLVNNTDDTLKYVGLREHESIMYHIDNNDMIIPDNNSRQNGKAEEVKILPHEKKMTFLELRFRKEPSESFTFKVGLSLLRWKDSYRAFPPDSTVIEKADILWSEGEKLLLKKAGYNRYSETEEEIKKHISWLYDTLTNKDRRNYLLDIDPQKIKKLKDTIFRYPKDKAVRYAVVPLVLSNKSDDTLKYFSMTCSWIEIYTISGRNVSFEYWDCTKNIPAVVVLPPHGSYTVKLPLVFEKNILDSSYRFKISAGLLRISDAWSPLDDPGSIFRDKRYMIWSNEIEIPASN